MSMNKKQQYQASIRDKVKDGLINGADGVWRRPDTTHSYMFRSLAFGYKLGLGLGLPVNKGKGK